jgi:hypothetical protein
MRIEFYRDKNTDKLTWDLNLNGKQLLSHNRIMDVNLEEKTREGYFLNNNLAFEAYQTFPKRNDVTPRRLLNWLIAAKFFLPWDGFKLRFTTNPEKIHQAVVKSPHFYSRLTEYVHTSKASIESLLEMRDDLETEAKKMLKRNRFSVLDENA